MIPASIEILCGPHIQKVDDTLEPGLTTLNWTSINVINFTENVHKSLGMNQTTIF